jgi:tRNA-specific 2-thiouridylase
MIHMNKNSVLVAMSGGVDSSVTALLLKEKGYNVVGVTMKLWDYENDKESRFQRCCSPSDIRDARRVADALGVNFYVLNLVEEFKNEVVSNFISEYSLGRTPNPCVLCNTRMKFFYLLKKADELGIPYLATGHYARIKKEGHNYYFLKAYDRRKDQSYFLFNTPVDVMQRLLMPVGDFYKEDVRKIAKLQGLKVAEKPDSQEICFIPDAHYSKFLIKSGLSEKKGKILDSQGNLLGYHNGYFNFTIGQREGLGIAAGKRMYVTRIDAISNTVIVGENSETLRSEFFVQKPQWFISVKSGDIIDCHVKIRYRNPDTPCRCEIINDDRLKVILQHPQRAIAPGQAAVFYHGDILIGGGWIE